MTERSGDIANTPETLSVQRGTGMEYDRTTPTMNTTRQHKRNKSRCNKK